MARLISGTYFESKCGDFFAWHFLGMRFYSIILTDKKEGTVHVETIQDLNFNYVLSSTTLTTDQNKFQDIAEKN